MCCKNINIYTQTFFKVWKRYGLKKAPKVILIETKQIIPDKNLFGESNLAANVVIQLSTVPARIRALSRRRQNSRLKNQSNQLSNVIKDHLDNVIATPSVNDMAVASISDVNSKSMDSNAFQGKKTKQSGDNQGENHSEGASEGESVGTDITGKNTSADGYVADDMNILMEGHNGDR